LSKLTDRVAELAAPVTEAAGCRLWDVEYVREAGTWYLRVFIDKDGGVSIDDCETVSRALDPILDREDPIAESYVFEVGSAGADRELKRPRDFDEFMGHEVEVRLYRPLEGSKHFTGTLSAYDDGAVSILLPTGKTQRFEKNQIAQVRLAVSIGG
jgi:ribosome maturation factor RimP